MIHEQNGDEMNSTHSRNSKTLDEFTESRDHNQGEVLSRNARPR